MEENLSESIPIVRLGVDQIWEITLLRERDQRVEALRRDVRAGFEAVERGEFTDYDESNIKELADRVKTRGRKRLAEEKAKTGAR
jgi:hypothetical protein